MQRNQMERARRAESPPPACLLVSMAGRSGVREGAARLAEGGAALDAIEAAIRLVETDPAERSVGTGGAPNILGGMELDASIMDGRTLKAGAVGNLQGFIHPICVARQVLERLPHTFLVGQGAARFAREVGAEPGASLTAESEAAWRRWLDENVPAGVRQQLADESGEETPLAEWVWRTVRRPEQTHGTVVVLAADAGGNLAGGVSTSGWDYKYPGRIGDSPVIGAGLYVDNRYGAVGCVGHGELAVRAGAARSVVLYMKLGASVQEAVHEAADDLRYLQRDFAASFAIHAIDRDRQPYVLMLGDEPGMRTFFFWTPGSEPAERDVVRAEW